MKVVIIEDEALAATRLRNMIYEYDADIKVLALLESVEESVAWFRKNPHPDLIFLDIHLEDDLSFAIFEQVNINSYIIFTTAFDEYAIKAFKLRSIDYLLKPIVKEELASALMKYHEIAGRPSENSDFHKLYDLISKRETIYRERFSVNLGQKIKTFYIDEVAYFASDTGYTRAILKNGDSYFLDMSLESLSQETDPSVFFRINRKMIISIKAIKDVQVYPKSRLKIILTPASEDEVFVSIDKVSSFKNWLAGEGITQSHSLR